MAKRGSLKANTRRQSHPQQFLRCKHINTAPILTRSDTHAKHHSKMLHQTRPSGLCQQSCGVKPLELDTCILDGELPIGFAMGLVAAPTPCREFSLQCRLVADALHFDSSPSLLASAANRIRARCRLLASLLTLTMFCSCSISSGFRWMRYFLATPLIPPLLHVSPIDFDVPRS